MKILYYVDRFIVGGVQFNSIELAATLQDVHGHEVILMGTPGPMVEFAKKKKLRFLEAPSAERHPSLARMRALRRAVKAEQPDLIHVWDWPACLDAFFSSYLFQGVPMIVSHMSMEIDRVLPRRVLTTFGTPELLDRAREMGRRQTELLLPPVDIEMNAPGMADPLVFREQYGVKEDEICVVTVSRLSNWLKAESLRRTIGAVQALGDRYPLRFFIVGEGDAQAELEVLAAETNRALGRPAVTFTGSFLDPRTAYASADLVVGMGSSALRALAFSKPVVVVGEDGFSAPFNPTTADMFYYQGLYGLGDGNLDSTRLAGDIREMVERKTEFQELGEFGRKFVMEHFGLVPLSSHLVDLYRMAVDDSSGFCATALDAGRTAALAAAAELLSEGSRERLKRLFRASPVTASASSVS